jgi:hypothetical protein
MPQGDCPLGRGAIVKELSFIDLVSAMRKRERVQFRDGLRAGILAWINGINLEDGSGRKWIIIAMLPDGIKREFYWDESKPCPFVDPV